MSLILKYSLKKGAILDKEAIKSCDEGAKAMQNLLVEASRITNSKITWLVWLLSRFYKKKVSKEAISYNFYFFPESNHKDLYKKEV